MRADDEKADESMPSFRLFDFLSSLLSDVTVSAKDTVLMESILEVMHTIWDSVSADLKKEENKAAKKVQLNIFNFNLLIRIMQYLKDTFNDEALEKLTSHFTTPKAHQAILRLASNLPKSNLTRFAANSLAKLKQVCTVR